MSNRKVTGTALKRILAAGKEYVDANDIGFREMTIDPEAGETVDPDTGFIIKTVTLCDHDIYNNIYESDVNNLLDDIFNR